MNARAHRKLLLDATIAWIAFWVIGLPRYYRQYSTTFMILFDALLLFPLVAAFLRVLKRARRKRRPRLSLWMAFYFTVPLAVYDWLYCGLYLGHGLAFVTIYWYLTVYYLVPWLALPACAAWLNRQAPPGRIGTARSSP